MKTVEEAYDIDEDLLEEMAEEGEYWNTAYNFYLEVKNKPADQLSEKQANWMESIEDRLSR